MFAVHSDTGLFTSCPLPPYKFTILNFISIPVTLGFLVSELHTGSAEFAKLSYKYLTLHFKVCFILLSDKQSSSEQYFVYTVLLNIIYVF